MVQLKLAYFEGSLSRVPSIGGFPGTSNQEETLHKTHITLERLLISFGLGTMWDPQGRTG